MWRFMLHTLTSHWPFGRVAVGRSSERLLRPGANGRTCGDRIRKILQNQPNAGAGGEEPPSRLPPGLYVVATPIGHARDITLRALDVLRGADALAAEDTRVVRRLLGIHGIPLGGRRPISYNDQSDETKRSRIIGLLSEGQSVALVSDAGTPLVADPGLKLVQAAIARGIPVRPVPGPSAALAALTASGLPGDRFLFVGFLPKKSARRARAIASLKGTEATMIFFERPSRLGKTLRSMSAEFGSGREAAVCRELTKMFEEVRRGTLGDLEAACAESSLKGECVIVVAGKEAERPGLADFEQELAERMATSTLKEAVASVSEEFAVARSEVYRAALRLKERPG